MKVSLEIEKKKNIIFAVIYLIMIAASYFAGAKWWVVLLFGLVLYPLIMLKLKLPEKLDLLWTVVLYISGAALSVFSIQYLLLDAEDFPKTTDFIYIVNFVLALAVFLIIHAVCNNVSLTCTIASIFLMVFAHVDYFVYEFRGNEFTYADLKSAGTGLSVVTKYSFSISQKNVYVVMALILYVLLARRIKIDIESTIGTRIISVMLAVICGLFVALNSVDLNTETWEKKGTYRNGYLLNFVLGIRDSFISEPDDYSVGAVKELEKNYTEADSSKSESDVKDPTIIVIMNESFSDLSVLGNLETNQPVTPFMDSLRQNTIRGYALSSVYGAKTPNSEWEYMTGNSMAFLPEGSVVYQQYIDDQPTSIVSTLKNNGYTCVGMHPYYSTGWSRNKVYPKLGFDETHFMDDFDETNILREYITDQELYDGIIDRYENRKNNEKLYIMGITMQNHGGYGTRYDNFDQEVYKLGDSYTDGNQYLSLIHESDKAFKNLITYFQNVDDPVEIVFFGDHQPGLYSEFIKLINGKGTSGLSEDEIEKLYTVPFYIWTNYETEAKTVDITSLNYLSTMTLERANIDLPAYNQFLVDMMEVVPAINSRGYYSKTAGGFLHIDEASGEEAEWIKNYNILQYNSMFDEKNKSSLFFPYIK